MAQQTFQVSISRPATLVLTAQGGAVGIDGFVHGAAPEIAAVRPVLVQDGCRVEAAWVHVEDGLLGPAEVPKHPITQDRLDGGFYVSAVFPWNRLLADGPAVIETQVAWRGSAAETIVLSPVEILRVEPVAGSGAVTGGRVGIVMATFEPDPALFARQIASIRGQTVQDFVCLIADDGSGPDTLRGIAAAVAGDARFHLLPPAGRLGFYRTFERACAALPPDCASVAFSDQDDAWRPDRLARQRDALGDLPAACAYSDMRLVDRDGRVLSETFWVHRKRTYGSLGGLLLGNVVTGMTILASRDLVTSALPFPATPNLTYHDHWIGLVAARTGHLRYLPEPLVDYVQHGRNHTGALAEHPRSRDVLAQALRRIRRFLQLGFVGQRPLAALREPFVLDWLDREPTRLRILVARLVAGPPRPGDRALRRLARQFGLLGLAGSGARWTDRYRRAYAIELWLGVVLKRRIRALARRRWLLPEGALPLEADPGSETPGAGPDVCATGAGNGRRERETS